MQGDANNNCVGVEPETVVVVGSGFGGAVTACRLAQAGFKVVVLERGRRYERDDFPNLPRSDAFVPDLRRWTWQHDQGLWDVVDLEEIVSVQAAGYGGGSLVYANVHLRPPPTVFDDRWPECYRGGTPLQPFYDLAAYMLDVSPVTAHPEFQKNLVKADQLHKVARKLEREASFFYPPLAIRYETGANVHDVHQEGCKACGACCSGCPHAAKSTLDFNYLALAERFGARVFTQCEVTQVVERGRSHWTVQCFDHLEAVRREFDAQYLFLCAGSIHTTRLLARAQLLADGARAQSLAGVGYFPGGDAMGMVYDARHPQYPSSGPTITTSTVHWDGGASPGSFFMIQDGGYAVELERLMGVFRSPIWVERNRLSLRKDLSVEKTELHPARPAPVVNPGLPLQSPLDALLDAKQQGNFLGIAAPAVRTELAVLLDHLKYPFLFPQVVEATIDGALRDNSKLGLLGRLPDFVRRLWTRVARWIAYRTTGSSSALASRALKALLDGAGLPPQKVANLILGYGSDKADRRAMLLAMGRDAATGVLHYDKQTDRLMADLDLFALAPSYASEEGLMIDMAGALGGELRTNPAWAFLGKPVTVHNQGGCRMSDSQDTGVTTPLGAVRGCEGLFIADGSLLCTSVGVNPSATIMALAEHNVLNFIRTKRGEAWPDHASAGARAYDRQRREAAEWFRRASANGWALSPPRLPTVEIKTKPLGLEFDEEMDGYWSETKANPGDDDDEYRRCETVGRPASPISLELHVEVDNLARFFEDDRHRMSLSGWITIGLLGRTSEKIRLDCGELELFVQKYKPHAIPATENLRREAQETATRAPYKTRAGQAPRGEERFLRYSMLFAAAGLQWRVDGYKRVREDPAIDAWRDTSSLYVTLFELPVDGAPVVRGAGVVHVELSTFLYKQLPSMRTRGKAAASGAAPNGSPKEKVDLQEAWAIATFSSFFFGSLQRIYVPEVATALDALFRPRRHTASRFPPRTAPRPGDE